MSIKEVRQPEVVFISQTLRLINPQKEEWVKASKWYENKKVMYYSEGITDRVYDLEDISRMYTYLSGIGELYFIEVFDKGSWRTIGDVTLSESNLPIVIGDENYWGIGLGKQIISKLLERASEIGLSKITIPEIYHYNSRSRNLFVSMGFVKCSENEKSEYYELVL